MNVTMLIEQMKAIVEQDGYPFLKHYKSDFYECDLRLLNALYTSKSRWLWILRENGSHLLRIGVHERETEAAFIYIDNAMKSTAIGGDFYVLSADGVKRLNQEQAKLAVMKIDYVVKGERIAKTSGEEIANIAVNAYTMPSDGNVYADVNVTSIPGYLPDLGDLSALAIIGVREAEKKAGSMFVKIKKFTFDEADIHDEIEKRKLNRALAQSEKRNQTEQELLFA